MDSLAFAYKSDLFATNYTQSYRDILQNRDSAYNSILFRTICTRIRKSAPQNLSFAYKIEDVSVPAALFIRKYKICLPQISRLRIK